MEVWKDIKDTGWKVSNEGNIKKPDGKIIRFRTKKYRECEVGKVHRIVAYYFCNPPGEVNDKWVCEGYEVHHKNRRPWDNRASNLEYLTYEEHNKTHKHKYKVPEYEEISRDFISSFLFSLRS